MLKIRLGLVSREGEGELTVLCDIVKKNNKSKTNGNILMGVSLFFYTEKKSGLFM